MFTITDRTCTPPAPAQPAPAAPSLHGGPPMPWAVREAEAHGGHIIRFKAYPNGLSGDLLVPEDEAVLARVAFLEDLITTLQVENETLRAELAAAGATVLPISTPPTDGIEAAVVTETERVETPEERAALVNELFAQLAVPVDPTEGATELPGGFVALAPELEHSTPTAEHTAPPTGEPGAPEVRAPEPVIEVGGEPAAQKTPKRLAVEAALKAAPHLSNVAIGAQCEVSDEYARRVRKALEAAGELEAPGAVGVRDTPEQTADPKVSTEAA